MIKSYRVRRQSMDNKKILRQYLPQKETERDRLTEEPFELDPDLGVPIGFGFDAYIKKNREL